MAARYVARSTTRRLAGVLLFSLAAGSGAAEAGAITPDAFAAGPAGNAYRAGRYAEALAQIDILLKREPQDPILLRVRGMALYRLERFAAAESAFAAAVAAAPRDPAARYWLGATKFKRGDRNGARAAFDEVERLAPGSRYAASAREFAAALETARAGPNTQADGKPWRLSVTTGVQYDDNVSLVNAQRAAAWRAFGEAEGRYVVPLAGDLSLALDGRVFGSGHFRAAADDFDLVSLVGGPTLIWRTALGAQPLRLSLGYAYEHIWEGARFYSGSHAITAKIETSLLRDSITAAAFTFGVDRFALRTGGDPALFSRDGLRYAVSIRHLHYLPGRRHAVWAGYEFTLYDTEGRNFDAAAHVGSAGLRLALPWALRLDLAAELGYTRYGDFAEQPKRRALKQTYTAWLTKAITRHLSLALAYAYTFDDSNIRDFETRRNLFTVSMRYEF
ncbi:MAG: tetratricopeptide repeat protein [Rhodospirillaceae bacterium]|nr:tetratricopeptide repeat protein [Rhodospirillaceae bacterium]